jgi:ADP-ribose pyrophosphatase
MAKIRDEDAAKPTPWRVVSRRNAFTVPGKMEIAVECVELPDGRVVDDYWQIKLNDFVVVIAETDTGEIVCLRQYRHGPRRASLEFIAGRIETGDGPLDTARRELLEESGYVGDQWQALGSFTVSATQGIATAHVFHASGVAKRQEPCSGDLEDSVAVLLSRDRLVEAVRDGEMITGSHLAALGLVLARGGWSDRR